jgi:hypothetical protein
MVDQGKEYFLQDLCFKITKFTYAGLQNCLQNKCKFLHGVSPDIGDLCVSIGRGSTQKQFFTALVSKVDICKNSLELFALPVKIAWIVIPNPIHWQGQNTKITLWFDFI